ncbi:MAG: hypothetical protein RL149_609 [Actinomycetota bacterium]
MRIHKLTAIFTATLVALSITGCAKLPTSSEVKVGSDIQGGLSADYLYYSPSGPTKDAEATEIINGFLNAATGPQNDYQVAREYLSSSLAADWDPSNELLIAEARPNVSLNANDSARVSFTAVASVDHLGKYSDLGYGVARNLDFTLIKEGGQWRINSAPNATVLVRPVFDVLFKSYALYFYDKQSRYLVPDLRWFATRVSTSTRLVSALLNGPTDWLSDAVQTSFPSKTKLALDSVIVENGKAIVDLDSAANHATVIQRQRMLAQLTSTLTQLANVFSVEVYIDHVPQKITNLPYEVSLANNPDPIVLAADGLKVMSSTPVVLAKSTKALADWRATDFGVNNQQTLLALKGPRGVGLAKIIGTENAVKAIDSRSNLLAPAIDPQGLVWTLGAGKESALQAFDSTGKLKFSSLGWIGNWSHTAFAVSREGGRIALLANDGKSSKLFVAAIERNENGIPVSISAPIQVGITQNIVRSLAWIDSTSIATIARNDEGATYPLYLQIGGEAKKLTPVADAVSVVANGLYSSSYVLDSNKQLRVLRSMTWIDSLSEILAIHFAG